MHILGIQNTHEISWLYIHLQTADRTHNSTAAEANKQ
jgi:hypothetical protein